MHSLFLKSFDILLFAWTITFEYGKLNLKHYLWLHSYNIIKNEELLFAVERFVTSIS